ncbi:MAG: site-specific integrase [Lachnospiraceae bacterium]|nr:site-specific integrase [Lachnospiraceae bacterium]
MSRPKKDGKRAIGVQGKKGYLYIVISQPVIKDGKKYSEKKWIKTGLTDTPENVKKATQARGRLLNRQTISTIDRNITVNDFIDYFLNKKKREVADTTYASYLWKSKSIKMHMGCLKVQELNVIIIESFLDTLFEEDHNQERTVKDKKVLLSAIIDQAVKDGIVAYNPVKEAKINKNLANKYAKVKKDDDEFFSYEEAQIFLIGIKNNELYEMFYVTLFFGLRREEILGIKWSAIDFDKKTLSIEHTVTKGTKINQQNTGKTISSIRKYPLTDEQVKMFINLKKKEKEFRKLFGKGYFENDYVFKHIDGTPYYPDYPTKSFHKIINSIPELPQKIKLHGLRTSCVSILVHEGMDVKSIQKWVGHKDINTTLKIYAKVKEKEAKQQISNAMTNVLPLKKYDNK